MGFGEGENGRTCTELHQERTFPEVEHLKAHRSKKQKQEVTLFERKITDGTDRADELAKDAAVLDGGEMEKREEVHAALQYAASFR